MASDSRERQMAAAQQSIANSLKDMTRIMITFNENLVTAMSQFKTWLEQADVDATVEVDDSNREIDYVEQLPDGTKRYFFKEVSDVDLQELKFTDGFGDEIGKEDPDAT